MEALGTGCFLERRDGTGVGNGVWTGGDVVDVVHIHDFSKNLSVDRLGDVRVKMISFGGSVDALCLRERSDALGECSDEGVVDALCLRERSDALGECSYGGSKGGDVLKHGRETDG